MIAESSTPPADTDGDQLIRAAVAEIAVGRPVIVTDDPDRENEGDLICAAELASVKTLAQMIRYTSGIICVAMIADDLDRLMLPAMTGENADPRQTAFAISVDAADGVSTGVCAQDRTRTIRRLAAPDTAPSDLTRPGHVFPLRARAGGVLERRGHTEAGTDLTRLAGLHPSAVLAELTNDDGTMMRGSQLSDFARVHQLTVISIEQLTRFCRQSQSGVDRVATSRLPTRYGEFTALVHRSRTTGQEHLTVAAHDLASHSTRVEAVPVRVHSECLTGETFGSLRCDCDLQLQDALAKIGNAGHGAVIYLRGHEGRGIGLGAKVQAYALQDQGQDTITANHSLGLPADVRDYADAAAILADLGICSIDLITNNPAKRRHLEDQGITVAHQIPTPTFVNPENLGYLRTKRNQLGHRLELPDPEPESGPVDVWIGQSV